jgi:hypothetical protein
MAKTFKTEEERLAALKSLTQSPPPGVDIDKWNEEQEALEKEIEEAVIGPDASSPEPQVQEKQEEPQVQPETEQATQTGQETSPQATVEDILQFHLKRDELPEELRGYKDPNEIVKQFAHARRYANDTETKMKQLEQEREDLRKQIEAFGKNPPIAQKAQTVQSVEDEVNDLTALLDRVKKTEDDDFINAGEVKPVLTAATSEIVNLRKKLSTLENAVNTKFTEYESVNKQRTQQDEQQRQMESTVKGIVELQDKNPELKTNKPLLMIQNQGNSVERDVQTFADRVLATKFGNNNPTWQQRNAIINSYLDGNQEIIAYCQNNAITPESVGTTADDIKKYAVVINVDANMRGQEIDRITGERKQKISPFNGKPVNFDSYITSYENLKHVSGISKKEQQKAIADAEIRGQQSLENALSIKADIPKTLSDSGSARPEDAGQTMTKEAAEKIFYDQQTQNIIEEAARIGDRGPFNKYNAALKVLGIPEEAPDENWPPERVRK